MAIICLGYVLCLDHNTSFLDSVPEPLHYCFGPYFLSNHLLNTPGHIVPLKATKHVPISAASNDIFSSSLEIQFPNSCT